MLGTNIYLSIFSEFVATRYLITFTTAKKAFVSETFSNCHATHENVNLLEFEQKKILILF